jgi:hypothetical protein
MNENESLIHGLQLNNIEQDNIDKFFQLKEYAEKLGFTFSDSDGMDDTFYIQFEIKNDFTIY